MIIRCSSIHQLTSGHPGSGHGSSWLFQKSLFPATLSCSSWGVPRPDERCNPPRVLVLAWGPLWVGCITHWWKYNYKSSISALWWIKICTLDLSFFLKSNVFIYLELLNYEVWVDTFVFVECCFFLFFLFQTCCVICRDLKPENILLDDNGEFWNFISSDFWILHCSAFCCWYTISDYISALWSTELWVNEMHHAVILQDTSVFRTWDWPSKCLKESSSEAEWGLWAIWVRKTAISTPLGKFTGK